MSFLTKASDTALGPRGNLNELSGPSGGPATFSDPEIEYEKDGRYKSRQAQMKKTPTEDIPLRRGKSWQHEGSNNSLISNPNLMEVGQLPYGKPSQAHASFLVRVEVLAKNLFFNDVLSTIKSLYPGLKMELPKPPTYVWNPGAPKVEPKTKEGEEEPEADEPADASQIDVQGIKNRITMKFPDLKWSARDLDGALSAELAFKDGSYVEFSIGAKANHLTLVYNAAKAA